MLRLPVRTAVVPAILPAMVARAEEPGDGRAELLIRGYGGEIWADRS